MSFRFFLGFIFNYLHALYTHESEFSSKLPTFFSGESKSSRPGLSLHLEKLLPMCSLQSNTTSFSFIQESPLLVGGFATGFGGFGGGLGGPEVSSRSKNCGGNASWKAATFRMPLSLSRRKACIRNTCLRWRMRFTAKNTAIPIMLRAIIVTLTPIPAFAPVLSPLLADVVAAFTVDRMVGVCV